MTTQHLEEADRLADRLAVLDGGILVAEGSTAELKRLVSGGHLELHFTDLTALTTANRVLGSDAIERDLNALALRVPTDGSLPSLRALLGRVGDQAVQVATLSVHMPDLDDVFFALIGRTGTVQPAIADGEEV